MDNEQLKREMDILSKEKKSLKDELEAMKIRLEETIHRFEYWTVLCSIDSSDKEMYFMKEKNDWAVEKETLMKRIHELSEFVFFYIAKISPL